MTVLVTNHQNHGAQNPQGIAQRQVLVANLTGGVREAFEGGKRWLVAPAAILIEGVLNGSRAALFYPAEESRKTAHLWNVPITNLHPFDPISNAPLPSNAPGVAERQFIGETRNPTWNGKTRVEAWFDADATKNKAREVYDHLEMARAGKTTEPIPLSTGLFTDNEPTRGTFNSTPYDAIARNHRPDHLAVLMNQRGACHTDQGCGVGVTNSEGDDKDCKT